MQFPVTRLVAAIGLAVASSVATASDWLDARPTKDGGYYSGTESMRFENSVLGIYAYPNKNCEPMLANTFFPKNNLEHGQFNTELRIRIDKKRVHYLDGLQTVDGKGIEPGKERVIFGINFNNRLLREFLSGSTLIFDDNIGDEAMKTDEFSLAGSSIALNDVVDACQNHDEWSVGNRSDDEWDDDKPSFTRDPESEWRS